MQIFIALCMVLVLIFGVTAFTGAPFVPSRKADLKKAFAKLYPLGKTDVLIDLGAGSGTVLQAAHARGAQVIGLELNPLLALLAKLRAPYAKILCINYYHYHFPPDTTVVYAFADSRDIGKIYKKVQAEATRLHHEIYLISLAFDIPAVEPTKTSGPYYLYKVTDAVKS